MLSWLRFRRIRGLFSGMLLISVGILFITSYNMRVKGWRKSDIKTLPQIKNTLVDMPEIDSNFNISGLNQPSFRILFINRSKYIRLNEGNHYIKNNCYFKNCILTDEVKNLSHFSAIVFNAEDDLQYNGTYLKQARPSSQIWILYRLEPIAAVRGYWFRESLWKNTMNWTWGYRLDSDIFLPYQLLATRTKQLNRDYYSVYKRKTKMAAWIVSHCRADSLRDEYVRTLIKEGVNVDIFGRCSKNRTRFRGTRIHQQINTTYKFYLSFENNFCKDYVSEKFFSNIAMDTILVVRGGLNYSEHFDTNAFIDTAWFPTVKSLARYMLKVSNDSYLYSGYLRAKDKYIVHGTPGYSRTVSMCKLCEHMNNLKHYKKTYPDVASYLENATCFNPKVIV